MRLWGGAGGGLFQREGMGWGRVRDVSEDDTDGIRYGEFIKGFV